MPSRIPFWILTVLLLSSASPFAALHLDSDEATVEDAVDQIERLRLTPDPDSIGDAHPSASWDGEEMVRPTTAETHLGIFTADGLQSDVEVPAVLAEVREDIALVLIDGQMGLWEARVALTALRGVEVRAHIPPSGFLLQGHPDALAAAAEIDGVVAVHALPLAFVVDAQVRDMFEIAADLDPDLIPATAVLMAGWRLADLGTPQDHVRLASLTGDLDRTAADLLTNHRPIDTGRHHGVLALADVATAAAEPALGWLTLEPVFRPHNDIAIGHMRADDVSNFFTIDLNGSGQSITVADSGIDRDHGDFNGRIQHVESVIWGDTSSEDMHSGHGTHVACTVLGNGSRGGYAGIAPQATLRFQAMEDDSSGNFGGVSMDTLIRKAYEGNSHIHTNSWGANGYYGEYTTSSEDADSRTNLYDQFWSYDGMLVLVSAGNDGSDSDTITPPATAKNVIAVGNHHNRGGGAPATLSQSSSRGPTDDGRIKPDLTAPGSWVRSCRSQDAGDVSTATWTNTWYLEYSGTSMAAPNAAGASLLIREYLMEVAGRPAPQGALIKAMLILGAEDTGTRDIPNMDEGWGRVNLANSLIPGTDTGIWVDDRNSMRSGQTRQYSFNLSRSNTPFKAVLAWSDYPGSTWATTQLQNNLDMVITAPDGTVYKGNDFAGGASTTGGDADDVNNVEVILIDSADMGVWLVNITDVSHGGQRSDQTFALAVRGAGVNDLRSDPLPIGASFQLSTAIPQVNDECQISIQIENQGGGRAEGLRIQAIAGGQNLGEVEIDLGPGMTRWATWDWTPVNEGTQTITIRIDANNDFEEIDEDNNLFETIVAVSAPGVRVTSPMTVKDIVDSTSTSTSWELSIRNTALLPTNASISSSNAQRITDGAVMDGWFKSFTQTTFALDGAESESLTFTLVHNIAPPPGLYQLTITAHDEDNDLDFPLTLTLDVPVLPGVSFLMPFSTLQVHPSEPTSFTIDVQNEGNGFQGYNLYLEAPNSWWVGLDSLGSTTAASSGSTGAIPLDGARTVDMTVVPPDGVTPAAGLALVANLRVISQVDPLQQWLQPIPMVVIEHAEAIIEEESTPGVLRPDSTVYIQFTITNLGNTALMLQPNVDNRPGGWSVVLGSQAFDVPIGEAMPYVLGLEGNGLAVGGPLTLRLSTDDGFVTTWSGALEVVEEAQLNVEFISVASMLDEPISEVPAGVPGFKASWRIINDGSAAWTPTLSLSLPDETWSGICDPAGQIDGGGTADVVCMITAPSYAMAGWQPEIGLVVDADGVIETSSVQVPIAANPAVVWRTLSIEEAKEGETSMIHLEIENLGNTRIEHRVMVDAPKGWTASIEGDAIASLAIGASQGFRISILPTDPGASTVSFSLDGAENVPGSSHEVPLDVIDDPNRSSESGFSANVGMIGLILLILVGGIAAAILMIQLRRKPPETAPAPTAFSTPMVTAIAPSLTAPILAAEPPPSVLCWGCNQAIDGPRLACPSCGARYHDEGHECEAASMQNCRNCEGESNLFVKEASF